MYMIHQNAQKGSIDFLRIWIFGIWLCIIIFQLHPIDFRFMPPIAFEATGLFLKCLPEATKAILLSEGFILILKLFLLINLTFVILNFSIKINCISAAILLTLEQAILRGFGHVNHGEIILLYSVYVMSIYFFLQGNMERDNMRNLNLYSIPFVSILFLLCLSYTLIGIRRLVDGGIDLFMSDSILMMIIRNSNWSGFLSWHLDEIVMKNDLLKIFFRAGFPVTTIFEILAPFALIFRCFRYVFLLVMFVFHLFSWIFLGILFWENLLLYILFLERISQLRLTNLLGRIKLFFKNISISV